MIKKLLPLFLLFGFVCHSQTFEWVKTPTAEINVNPQSLGYSTVVDPSGNVYLSGYKDNPTIHTELFGSLFYIKYNANGEVLFTKAINGTAVLNQMETDSQGNILLAISYLNSLSFDTLSLESIDQSPQHVFIKLDSNGNLLFHKEVSIPENNVSSFQAISVDASDNIYIGYDNYHYGYIQKLSPNGDEVSMIMQANVSRITSIDVDSEGNIYASGTCANPNSTYAGVAQPTDLSYTVYVVKYTANGVFQWLNYIEDITCGVAMVKVQNPDEIYLCSPTFIQNVLGDFTLEGPLNGGLDFYLTKLDASGNYVWVREVPGNGSVDVGTKNFLNLDAQGNIYFSGIISGGVINWGNGITSNTNTFGNREALVLKYNPQGEILMAALAGGTSNDEANSISIDPNGSIYVSGLIRGSATFGTLSFTADDPLDYTPFLAKIQDDNLSVPHNALTDLRVYPNPVTNLLTVQTAETIVNLTVFSLNGQRMQLPQNGNQLDFSGVANGVYVVEVVMENGVKRVKVVR